MAENRGIVSAGPTPPLGIPVSDPDSAPSSSRLSTLPEARARIDDLDAEIQALIAARARVAEQVRAIKNREGGPSNDLYRPAREAEVLRKAIARNQGPLPDEAIARLMREIMSACLALEAPLSVAYLGPEGTYTQAAVIKQFGHAVAARPHASIPDIFRDVESGASLYGVVPVENSTEGVVTHTLDQLALTPLTICGEVFLPVHHHLLARGGRVSDVTKVFAHPQALAQCRLWLDAHLPRAERVAMPSNAAAALKVADEGEGAAIAGAAAGELYGLETLAVNIEDDPGNTTRFLVIGRQEPAPTGQDATAVVFSQHHDHPGGLFELLKPFAEAGINLSRIESRPSRRAAWDYNFHIETEGHQQEPRLAEVLEKLRARAGFFRVLGSWPKPVY